MPGAASWPSYISISAATALQAVHEAQPTHVLTCQDSNGASRRHCHGNQRQQPTIVALKEKNRCICGHLASGLAGLRINRLITDNSTNGINVLLLLMSDEK